MTTLLKTTALTLISAFTIGTNANAMSAQTGLNIGTLIVREAALTKVEAEPVFTPTINLSAKIGIARIDKGRLIYAPSVELRDWAFLDNRSAANFAPVSPAALIKNLPEVPMNGKDSDNKLDEIRMTASDLRMDYVLIYGMGNDAQWGSFGGKAMSDTGLVSKSDAISPRGNAKAILVNTYTGEIYGTITSDKVEFSIGDLTDKAEIMINELGADTSSRKA